MENPKLLPCAHCGSDDIALKRTVNDETPFWHAVCTNCGIQTLKYEECVGFGSLDEVNNAMKDAIECACNAWNTRNGIVEDQTNDNSDNTMADISKQINDLIGWMRSFCDDKEEK